MNARGPPGTPIPPALPGMVCGRGLVDFDVVAKASATAVTIVGAAPGQKGFAVQPRRWVVERTFSHAGRCRRLARDYEGTDEAALGFFVLANAMVLVRRIAREL